ncbi:MAG: recombination-associated protein RdgC [Chromatiales bacterium]|jgi:recombination associated protein RdgC|nr:recombination-associated protein RdgC [Chromatiales bacterium]
MWFKNIKLYRFLQPFRMTPEQLGERLEVQRFSACGRLEMSSYGFVPPGGGGDESPLVHATNGFLLMAGCQEEKLLPASVVREAAAERIEAMEAERGISVPKRERERVMDEMRFEMLPRAFTRSQRTFGYIDPIEGYLVVDASTDAKADSFIGALQDALGALPVSLPVTQLRPATVMTGWLTQGEMPQDFDVEQECELRLPGDGGAVARCKNQDMASREILTHLEAGKEAIKLAVIYGERLRFVLDEHLNIRRLRFLELIKEEAADVDAQSHIERLDADFAVTSLELRAFIKRLIEVFGGEDVQAMGIES